MRATLLAISVVGIVACADDAGIVPRTVLRPAALVMDSAGAAVIAPDTVRLGLPIPLVARSYGGGCSLADETGVQVTGARIDVRPTVSEPHPAFPVACDAMLRILDHPVSVTYNRVGPVTVVVHGRREPGGAAMSITRTIEVVR